ncbi:MAG: RagB/SusD family nutrient uptake outer membrane protein, partial [Maribacter sp.]|nr:RagB/SusD family nutrient uptake outer membrane protein [Maribacter sp.]
DLRRWGNSTEIMNAYFQNEARIITNFGQKVGTWSPTYDLFPIPLSAIDLSGGILTQNPGY